MTLWVYIVIPQLLNFIIVNSKPMYLEYKIEHYTVC